MGAYEGFHLYSLIFDSRTRLKLKTFNKAFRKTKFLCNGSIHKLEMLELLLQFYIILLKDLNFVLEFLDLLKFCFVTMSQAIHLFILLF